MVQLQSGILPSVPSLNLSIQLFFFCSNLAPEANYPDGDFNVEVYKIYRPPSQRLSGTRIKYLAVK